LTRRSQAATTEMKVWDDTARHVRHRYRAPPCISSCGTRAAVGAQRDPLAAASIGPCTYAQTHTRGSVRHEPRRLEFIGRSDAATQAAAGGANPLEVAICSHTHPTQ
jgi:hypothetical protein